MGIKVSRGLGYLGNKNLKPSGVKIEFTQEQVEEYMKCAKDPIYFAKKYVKVVTLDKGVTQFDLYDYQERLVNKLCTNRFVIGKLARQSGKALSLDTLIPTKHGWTTMGEIQVGDEIFSSNGTLTKVNFKSEIFTDHDCYKLYFDNGEVVTADANHLWKVKTTRNKEYVLNTLEIFNKYQTIKPNTRGNGFVVGYHVDIQQCLELPEQDLPIDPYLLGLWLGDGYSSSGRIISHKNDFSEYKNNTSFQIKSQRVENNCVVATIENLHTNLNKLNLLKNKHIPQIYLRSSKEQRLQLLRGLMDTDGSIKKNTRSYEFYQKDSVLVDNFIELISSLGIKCRKRIKIINDRKYITVSFTTSEQVFNLIRKIKNVGNDKNIKKANSRIHIHKIEKVDSVHTACIQVEDESHMFLFGNWMIPTHNTTTVGCCYLLHKVLFNQNMSIAILANKLNTAREILSRIREAYEHLPWWLQQGILEWNKGSIQLENGSKILASATSSSAIRGGSYNCISGTSIITIKDNLTGEIYNISIEDFYSNSSRNTDYYKYFDDNDGKQIQEMVFFSDGEGEKENRYITGVRKTPYNSTISGWDKYERQSCSINYKRTFIGTSSFTSFFDRDRKSKNVPCILSNGEWETGQICENVPISYNGSENQLFRSEKNYASGIETFRRNKEKNIQVKQRKNNFTGSSPENKQFEYWSFDRNQKTQWLWGKNFKDIDREKENKRTLGQNKQKSRKNQKDSINTSWNETITRSKRKNATSSFIAYTKKWWSVEQRKEITRWEVLTANGFKSFRGISKTHNRATIKLVFDNNSELICTEDHKIATNDGFIEAKKLNKNHEVISSNNILHLVDIINHDDSHVYDLLEVTDTHSFFANSILVHNCIFLDEFAFVPTTVAEEFFSSVYPTITAGQSTQMIIISTPKGLNMFYQLWKGAISKQNEYVAFEVNWQEVPQYPGGPLRDEPWKEQQIKNTSERQFDAEFNCVSGDTLITIKDEISNEIYTLPISEFYEWVD